MTVLPGGAGPGGLERGFRMRPALVAFCFATSLAAQASIRHTTDPFPGDDREGWLVTRVVDDLTGAPIAGAELFLVGERTTPIAGEFWFARKGTSDDAGFVRIPIEDIAGQWHIQVLRHPRCGVSSRFDIGDPVWRIGRPFDVPVLVRDWQGRPAPGARVGFCGGCGHTPDLATAIAGADGIAVLRGIDPHNDVADLYVQHPDLGLGYEALHWFPSDPPFVLDCPLAPAMTGTVVDHLGHAVAGAFVGAPGVHRGPWARTDHDGSFTLLGGDPNIGASRVVLPGGREIHFPAPAAYPAMLRLPDLSDPDAHEGSTGVAEGSRAEPTTRADTRTEGGARREFAPTLVAGRVVDERGQPVPARARLRAPWTDRSGQPGFSTFPDGRIALSVAATGLVLLEIVPDPEKLRPRLAWVTLPHRGAGAKVDVGPIAVSPAPPLRVLAAGGAPIPGAVASFARAGLQEAGDLATFPLDGPGGWLGPDLGAGDVIVVRVDPEAVPCRTVLEGAGPWTITPPEGRLQLEVAAGGARPVVATVLFADQCLESTGPLSLRGLSPGPLRLFVSAPGRQTAIVDTVIGPEPATLRLELPAR